MENDYGSFSFFNGYSLFKLLRIIREIVLGKFEIVFIIKLFCIMEFGVVKYDLINNGVI